MLNVIVPKEPLPTQPLSGMVNKHGNKVRLHFKTALEELWIGTKGVWFEFLDVCTCNLCNFIPCTHTERTEKLPIHSIRTVVSEPIKGHPDYHIMVLPSGIPSQC